MLTERLYYQDGHARTFEAVVTACEKQKGGYGVALDRTCFFPEGGGQFGDRGDLRPLDGGEALPVTDTYERDGFVWHETAVPLPVGARVEGSLDWALRFARMQCHSGEHIASGLFHTLYGLDNVGFHLGDEEMTIDLSGPVTWADVQQVQRLANAAVAEDLPVLAEFPEPVRLQGMAYRSKLDLTQNVRIVTIPGYDVCACCAPHVKRTGEIGLVHFLSLQNYKGGVRIRMLCGSRAVEDVIAKQESVGEISVLLSAKQSGVAEAVRRLTQELEQVKARAAALGRQAAKARVEALPEASGDLLLFEALDTESLRALVNGAVAKGAGLCAAFAPDGTRWQYILGSASTDLRPLVREMNAALSGRGGGSAQMVQGSVGASRAEISAWWEGRFPRSTEGIHGV